MSTAPKAPSPSADERRCLAWAIKDSLIAYVQGTVDGQVWVSPNVEVNADGEFLFPFDDDASGPGGTSPAAFAGEVALTAHGGFLQLLFADPRIEADGTLTIRIAAVDAHRSDGPGDALVETAEPGAPETRLRLATVGPEAAPPSPASPTSADHNAHRSDGSLRCVLTTEGADYFQGMYPEGLELAPIALNLPTTAGSTVRTQHRIALPPHPEAHSHDHPPQPRSCGRRPR